MCIFSCISEQQKEQSFYVRNVCHALHREEVAHSFVLLLSLTTVVVEKTNEGIIFHNDYEGNESEGISLTATFGPSLHFSVNQSKSNHVSDVFL